MEGDDSDSDTPYVDINSFLELGIKADVAPIKSASPAPRAPAARPRARPAPRTQVNGSQQHDPLHIPAPTKPANSSHKPANMPEITFVDVNRILDPPRITFQPPRIPAGITLTRHRAPNQNNSQPRFNRPQNTPRFPANNKMRPQLNPRYVGLTRPQMNPRLANNAMRPHLNPRLQDSVRFRLNPLAVNAIRPNLNARLVNNPRNQLIGRQLLQQRQLNTQFRPQLTPRIPNNALKVTFDPSKLGVRLPNSRLSNPRATNSLNVRLPNSQLLNPRTANPVNICLPNSQLLNPSATNPVRIQPNPRVPNNFVRPPLSSKQMVNGRQQMSANIRPNPMNISSRLGYTLELRPSKQPQVAADKKLYQDTVKAIQAKSGVTLVPLGNSAGSSQAKPPSASVVVKTEKKKPKDSEEDRACNICLKTFAHMKSLRRHMARAHKNVMQELPARKSTRSRAATKESIVDASNSEAEEEAELEDEVEVLAPPPKKPKLMVNLSDEEEGPNQDYDDEDSGMLDISNFLEVNLEAEPRRPVIKCPECEVRLVRLAEWVVVDETYKLQRNGDEYSILPQEQEVFTIPKFVPGEPHPAIPPDLVVPMDDSFDGIAALEATSFDEALLIAAASLSCDIDMEPTVDLPPLVSLEPPPPLLEVQPGLQVSFDSHFCQACNGTFPTAELLAQHNCAVPFVCEVCHQAFTDCGLMIEHLRAHIENSKG